MKKLLGCDFDGTLRLHAPFKEGYRQEDLEAVRRFQQAGGLIGLNTGRSMKGFSQEELEGAPDFDFYISDSGGCIADGNGTILFEKLVDYDIVMKVRAAFPDEMFFVSADGLYWTEPGIRHPFFDNPLPDMDALRQMKIHGFAIEPGDPQKAKEIQKQLDAMDLDISSQVNLESVDICASGCSKGEALQWIARHFGIAPEEVYAIGDGANDIPALQQAAIGFAMSHADPALIEEADQVVDGVAQAISHILCTDPAGEWEDPAGMKETTR